MLDEINIKTQILIPIIVASVFTLLFFILTQLLDHNKAIFCDVGQGDATYLRINSVDILVDAGPSKKVLNCLGKHMPFYDKKIEIAILTHPQTDHFTGYFYVIKRYKIDYFLTPAIEKNNLSFKKLENILEEKEIEREFPTAGFKIKIKDSYILFYWPTKEYLKTENSDVNSYSTVFIVKTPNYSILFTGDANQEVLNRLSYWAKQKKADIFKTNLLKVPHHGSAEGLTWDFLNLAKPDIALISVGKNNPYGHPHPKIINYLKALNVYIWRTDLQGELKITL